MVGPNVGAFMNDVECLTLSSAGVREESWVKDNPIIAVLGAGGEPESDSLLTNTDKANARLIAAAPDLLEAAVQFSKCRAEAVMVSSDLQYALRMAETAIAKATGETP